MALSLALLCLGGCTQDESIEVRDCRATLVVGEEATWEVSYSTDLPEPTTVSEILVKPSDVLEVVSVKNPEEVVDSVASGVWEPYSALVSVKASRPGSGEVRMLIDNSATADTEEIVVVMPIEVVDELPGDASPGACEPTFAQAKLRTR